MASSDPINPQHYYLDARNQLMELLGFGANFPLRTPGIHNSHMGKYDEEIEAWCAIVPYGEQEIVYIDYPQEGVIYQLIRSAVMEDPIRAGDSYQQQLEEFKAYCHAENLDISTGEPDDRLIDSALTDDWRHASIQQSLPLHTETITNDRTCYRIIAIHVERGFRQTLSQPVVIKAGVNMDLPVTALADFPLPYGATVTLQVEGAQAQCFYMLYAYTNQDAIAHLTKPVDWHHTVKEDVVIDPVSRQVTIVGQGEPETEGGPNTDLDLGTNSGILSPPEMQTEPATIQMETVSLQENTLLQVYVEYFRTGIYGTLNQKIFARILPNRYAGAFAERRIFTNYEVAVVSIPCAQASVYYQLEYCWVEENVYDPPCPEEVPSTNGQYHIPEGMPKAGDVATEPRRPEQDGLFQISFRKPVGADLVVKVKAFKKIDEQQNLTADNTDQPVYLTDVVQIYRLPDENVLVSAPRSRWVDPGESMSFWIKPEEGQPGVLYELFAENNPDTIIDRQYRSANHLIQGEEGYIIGRNEYDRSTRPNTVSFDTAMREELAGYATDCSHHPAEAYERFREPPTLREGGRGRRGPTFDPYTAVIGNRYAYQQVNYAVNCYKGQTLYLHTGPVYQETTYRVRATKHYYHAYLQQFVKSTTVLDRRITVRVRKNPRG